jgi:hypothetical protein
MKIESNGKLVGTRLEKVDFVINMFLWKHFIVVIVLEILLFFFIGLHCKRFAAFIPLILFVLSWVGYLFYPHRPPVLNFVKAALLKEGMFVRVNAEPNRSRPFSRLVTFHPGTVISYKNGLYLVKVYNEEQYYEFQEISPLYWPDAYEEQRSDTSPYPGWYKS